MTVKTKENCCLKISYFHKNLTVDLNKDFPCRRQHNFEHILIFTWSKFRSWPKYSLCLHTWRPDKIASSKARELFYSEMAQDFVLTHSLWMAETLREGSERKWRHWNVATKEHSRQFQTEMASSLAWLKKASISMIRTSFSFFENGMGVCPFHILMS